MVQLKKTVAFRDIWIDRHHNGVVLTLARFVLVTLVDIVFIICRPFLIITQLIFDAFRRGFTRPQKHAHQESHSHREASNSGNRTPQHAHHRSGSDESKSVVGHFEGDAIRYRLAQQLLQPIPAPTPISIKGDQTDSKPNGRFFSMLPPEVRRCILIHAFGHCTMHMSVLFQQPWKVVDAMPQYDPTSHVQHYSTAHARHYHNFAVGTSKWRWYGCVCHRTAPEDAPLSLGRTRSWPVKPRSFLLDGCLAGQGTCSEWPGTWPSKCQIGVAGWLRTCRQAYVEGVEVLYRTNTIQMASIPLLRGMHDILPSTTLSLLTSLELLWHPYCIPLTDACKGYRPQEKENTVLPSLTHLRICMVGLRLRSYQEFRILTNANHIPAEVIAELMEVAAPEQFELFDMAIKRIAPASANVTISLENLAFYQAAEVHLTKTQGRAVTRPQVSEFGGLKHWRQLSTVEDKTLTPQRIEEGEALNQALGGYWVHIVEEAADGPIHEEDCHLYQERSFLI